MTGYQLVKFLLPAKYDAYQASTSDMPLFRTAEVYLNYAEAKAELGKTFRGKDWSVTARAGTSWQFDLLNNGETVLRDASGEKRIKGEKDSRMLFNVGMNAQIKDNMRFGLEFEKSAFGKYNVDNAINANFRYMF